MRPVRGLTAVLACAALLAPGCDDSEERTHARESTPADIVPRDAYLYADVTLRLSGRTGGPARRFARNLTGASSIPDDALIEIVGRALGDPGFERDIDPWFGNRAALFVVRQPSDDAGVGLILDAANPRALPAFFRKHLGPGARQVEHRGVAYRRGSDDRAAGRIGKRVVLASSDDVMRAAIDARRAPFSSTARYRRARGDGPLPLAFGTVDIARTVDGIGRQVPLARAEREALDLLFPRTGEARFMLTVGPRDAKGKVTGLDASDEPAPPIEDLPSDTWLAISSGNLATFLASPVAGRGAPRGPFGTAFGRILGVRIPESMLQELRRGTFFVQGGAEVPSGELRADVENRRVVARGVERLGRRIKRSGRYNVELSPVPGEAYFTATGLSQTIEELSVQLQDDTLTMDFGVTGSSDELSDGAGYRRARRALGAPPTALFDVTALADSGFWNEAAAFGRLSLIAARERLRDDELEVSFLLSLARER